MKIEFSAIIPLFNKEGTILRALRSVVSQSYPVKEIVVVDDGSTDNGRSIVEAFAKETPSVSVQIIKQENMGVSVARNVGAKFACSPYIAFLDADDEWDSHHIAYLADLANRFPTASMLSCCSVMANEKNKVQKKCFSGRIMLCEPLEFGPIYAKSRHVLNSSSVAFYRNDFLIGGGFPEGAVRGEDICFWLRFSLHNWIALRSDITVMIHNTGVPEGRSAVVPEFFTWFSKNWHMLSKNERNSVKRFLTRSAYRASVSATLKGNFRVATEICDLMRRISWISAIPFVIFHMVLVFRRFL